MLTTLTSTLPLINLGATLDWMFDGLDVVTPSPARRRAPFQPPVNIGEYAEGYLVEADLPGMRMDEINVTVDGRELTISGERRPANCEAAAYRRRESPTGRFRRTFNLPETADPTAVEASLTNGVLTVQIPKTESAKPRTIEVRTR